MTAPLDLVLAGARLPDRRRADIGCRDGLIAEIGDLAGRPARRVVDVGGRAVTPGLVDAHVHLDKALLLDRAPGVLGTVAEAIRVTGAAKRTSRPTTCAPGPAARLNPNREYRTP